AKPLDGLDRCTDQLLRRRRHRAQHERARDLDLLDRLAGGQRAQPLDVDGDVRKLRHAATIAVYNRRVRVVALCLLAGCYLTFGLGRVKAVTGDGAPADSFTPTRCLNPTLTPVAGFPELNGLVTDDPALTNDRLEMFWS